MWLRTLCGRLCFLKPPLLASETIVLVWQLTFGLLLLLPTWRTQLCSPLLSLIALGSSGFVSMCATQSAQSAALGGDVA